MRFGEILVERGLVSSYDIAATLKKQEELRRRGVDEHLGVLLVFAGKLSAEALADIVFEMKDSSLYEQKRSSSASTGHPHGSRA